MKIDEALRIARARKKIKQHQLARSLGVTQQAVSGWERGIGVDAEHWSGIKEVLDLDIEALRSSPVGNNQNEFSGAIDPAQVVIDHQKGDGNVAVLPRGKRRRLVDLDDQEYEFIMLMRQAGNPTVTLKWMEQMRKAAEIFK